MNIKEALKPVAMARTCVLQDFGVSFYTRELRGSQLTIIFCNITNYPKFHTKLRFVLYRIQQNTFRAVNRYKSKECDKMKSALLLFYGLHL